MPFPIDTSARSERPRVFPQGPSTRPPSADGSTGRMHASCRAHPKWRGPLDPSKSIRVWLCDAHGKPRGIRDAARLGLQFGQDRI
jgi:hypothetical protein